MNKLAEPTIPFLRWAGGKSWLLQYLDTILPLSINNYHETFLGGASVFFHIRGKVKNAFLSDLNEELIATYIAIRDEAPEVIAQLKKFKNTKEFYYKIRQTDYEYSFQQAARFIFLNKTSFNGIYRVNREGVYNVPYGHRSNADFVNEEIILKASAALQNVTLKHRDFQSAFNSVKKGDLVFIDPPYTVAHENNGFIAYNQRLFTLEDQIRLAQEIEKLNERGVLYILTNAKHDAIKKIYKNLGKPLEVQRRSNIGGKQAYRGMINEYLYTNINSK